MQIFENRSEIDRNVELWVMGMKQVDRNATRASPSPNKVEYRVSLFSMMRWSIDYHSTTITRLLSLDYHSTTIRREIRLSTGVSEKKSNLGTTWTEMQWADITRVPTKFPFHREISEQSSSCCCCCWGTTWPIYAARECSISSLLVSYTAESHGEFAGESL